MIITMKRALVSVYDKTGIIEFAKALIEMGWEIISTGGTSRELKNAGIAVTDVSDITQFPECFDGRVKTLHPMLHGGLLAIRDNAEHVAKMKELNIKPIDLVINNLYPFKNTVLKENVTHEEIIENIDIGGPSMLRAAAKNYNFVAVVVDPADYQAVLEELKEKGEITYQSRQYLAAKVFKLTSHYDALIADYFAGLVYKTQPLELESANSFTVSYEKKQSLRYGENPHQLAAFFTEIGETAGTLTEANQLHGKELSFNNINDTNGALELLKEFSEPTVVAVKHANPCGVGNSDNIAEAFDKAYKADMLSIYGGIIAANREIDEQTAQMINNIFIEVVVAPSYSTDALEILRLKKNIRLLQLDNITKNDYRRFDIKHVLGGLLVQERDTILLNHDYQIVSKRRPTQQELEDLLFGWKVVKHVKSNAIVLAKDNATVAVGPGQVSRIWALENAIKQGGENVVGSVIASDAFFPFADSVEAAAKAGITAVIQPGGSMRDTESIEAADKNGIAMIFTGIRHFKH